MSAPLCSAPELRERLEHLTELHKAGELDEKGLEALVECSFRLAVHPDTPAPEAIQLLRGCVRLDGTNPKYGYHLARLYFVHGELDQAKAWLRLAFRLCPTSHRIWAHICLLQWKLQAEWEDDNEQEDPRQKFVGGLQQVLIDDRERDSDGASG